MQEKLKGRRMKRAIEEDFPIAEINHLAGPERTALQTIREAAPPAWSETASRDSLTLVVIGYPSGHHN